MGEITNEKLSFLDRGPYSFSVAGGAICGISGGSGAGKTLLLRAIADLEPHSGKIFLDGVSSEDCSGPQWRRKVCYLPAESLWWAELVGQHFAGELPDNWLKLLGFADDVVSWEVSRLSTGEKQRLALLRMMLNRPAVLLLDEPTASLDKANVAIVEEFILNYISRTSASCLWVSHDHEQLARLAHCHYEILSGGGMRKIR